MLPRYGHRIEKFRTLNTRSAVLIALAASALSGALIAAIVTLAAMSRF
jgi:hypothetical protein